MNTIAEKRKCKVLRKEYCDISTECFNLVFVVSYIYYHTWFSEDVPYSHQKGALELGKTLLLCVHLFCD